MSTAKPDYAVTAHGRARLEVTEMKAPVTFTPVLISNIYLISRGTKN
jgi:hypothetical protein